MFQEEGSIGDSPVQLFYFFALRLVQIYKQKRKDANRAPLLTKINLEVHSIP